MAGEINYGLVNPAVTDYVGQEQKTLSNQKARFDIQRLQEERQMMLGLQKQLADSGQNPDLNVVFDTMIKSGNPDYISKGLEGKAKLKEQEDFARVFYGNEAPAAYKAPATPTPANALAPVSTAAPAVAPTNALARPTMATDNTAALTQKINNLLALGTPRAIQAAQTLQGQLKTQTHPVMVPSKGTLVNPNTGEVIFRNTAAGGEGAGEGVPNLSKKDIQKREMSYPQATAAIQGYEAKSEAFIKDLEKLRDSKGLDEITGFAAGRLPGLTAEGRKAQALYDKIVAKGGFQALQDMRDASKTGGALGNVSEKEGKQLIASFAAIDRKQDAPDVREAINTAISDIQGAGTRMREAYDTTYEYRANKSEPKTPSTPIKVTTPEGRVFSFPNQEAANKFKKAAGIKD